MSTTRPASTADPVTDATTFDDDDYDDAYEGPSCSICDALGHGYPGGPPCPLEMTGRCECGGEPALDGFGCLCGGS